MEHESPDPNAKSWSAHLIGGKKMQLLGFVEAVSEPAAIESAVASLGLDKRSAGALLSISEASGP